MNKEIIKTVIREFQERELPEIFPREIEIPLNSSKITAITGPRRSGKTYLFYSLIKKLIENGTPFQQILYISFDDPRLLPIDSSGLEMILESFKELYPEHINDMNFVFFDEIQNVKDWEIGVRRIHDTRKFRIFLTGSSSKLLGKEIATQLRGRAINFELLPFSFREVLNTKGITLDKNVIYSQERFRILNLLMEYIDMGGFPEVVLEQDENIKLRILKEYLETMFFKDLIERYGIKNQIVLRELMKYIITNTSNIFSINAFYKLLKKTFPLTKRTLLNYVSFLEESGIAFLLRKFSFSLKEQMQTPRKSYIVDNGLRKVYGFKFSEDKGRSLENVVFIELKRWKNKDPLIDFFYFQDYQHHEIDFVIIRGREIKLLVQVCAELENEKVKQREINSLIEASKEFKCDNLLIITTEYEDIEIYRTKKIIFKPAWKWLIEVQK